MAQTVKLMLPNSSSHLICFKVLHWFKYNHLHICVGRLELSNLCSKPIISLQKILSVELISSKNRFTYRNDTCSRIWSRSSSSVKSKGYLTVIHKIKGLHESRPPKLSNFLRFAGRMIWCDDIISSALQKS